MRLFPIILLIVIILSAAVVCGCALPGGGSGDQTYPDFNNSHFTVASITCPPYFQGENVAVQTLVVDDEKEVVVASPTVTATRAPNSSNTTTTYVPTTVSVILGGIGTHTIVAELKGGPGVDVTRTGALSLKNNQSQVMSFDFGPVPAGSYVVTVTAPSYNNSVLSKPITIGAVPSLSQWTSLGDISVLLDNLEHDSVDVHLRNSGAHNITFGDGQYDIFANVSDSRGVELKGLNQTPAGPGQTVVIRAQIPIAGSYYLDCFSVMYPGRTALLKIPVNANVSAAA